MEAEDNGVTVVLQADANTAVGTPTASYNADSKTVTVKISSTGTTTDDAIDNAITSQTGFAATNSGRARRRRRGAIGPDQRAVGPRQLTRQRHAGRQQRH